VQILNTVFYLKSGVDEDWMWTNEKPETIEYYSTLIDPNIFLTIIILVQLAQNAYENRNVIVYLGL